MKSTRRLFRSLALVWASLARATCHAVNPGPASSSPTSPSSSILVVGATSTAGLRAVQGLLDIGYAPSQLRLVTRDASRPKMKELQRLGFDLVQADLQKPSSLRDIGRGCRGCYVHATGGDAKELDLGEVSSAQNLCDNLHANVKCVVYNSAAGAPDHGVKRIQQKHDIEGIFSKSERPRRVTSLRANIFGEELWKEYTRPQILKGRYPLPVNRWRKIYLTGVRDMGRLAGTIVSREEKDPTMTTDGAIRIMNVAGDHLTGPQIARTFGRAQGSRCRHHNDRELTKMAREGFPELHEQVRFLQTSREKTDVASLRREFPGLITPFAEFLRDTRWGDVERTFEDLSDAATLEF